jgi:predicted nuclease of predicted toxin-antitoxin system
VKLLFDHNLSPRLIDRLADIYPDSQHVFLIDLDRSLDEVVWEYARANGHTIVTRDADFSELSVVRGFPPKVIWVRRGNCTTTDIEMILRTNSALIAMLDEDTTTGILMLF